MGLYSGVDGRNRSSTRPRDSIDSSWHYVCEPKWRMRGFLQPTIALVSALAAHALSHPPPPLFKISAPAAHALRLTQDVSSKLPLISC